MFYFYAADGTEPAHVHVRRDRATAKIWLNPVTVARSRGFTSRELERILRITVRERHMMRERWDEFFEG